MAERKQEGEYLPRFWRSFIAPAALSQLVANLIAPRMGFLGRGELHLKEGGQTVGGFQLQVTLTRDETPDGGLRYAGALGHGIDR